eukprot:scaffold39938_cov183-Skeletonema_marinoi.AAC.2
MQSSLQPQRASAFNCGAVECKRRREHGHKHLHASLSRTCQFSRTFRWREQMVPQFLNDVKLGRGRCLSNDVEGRGLWLSGGKCRILDFYGRIQYLQVPR